MEWFSKWKRYTDYDTISKANSTMAMTETPGGEDFGDTTSGNFSTKLHIENSANDVSITNQSETTLREKDDVKPGTEEAHPGLINP